MSTYEFKLPDIGEGVSEGEIVKWLVAPGDVVVEDQPMVEVMTDKATVTITAPKAGKVTETRAAVGDVVPVHSVIVVFDIGGASAPEATPTPSPAPAAAPKSGESLSEGPAATAVGDIKETLPGMGPPRGRTPGAAVAPAASTYFSAKVLATPATRKLARDLGIDLRTVPPTGPHGRVTKDDVQRIKLGGRGHEPELAGLSAAPAKDRGAVPATPARAAAPLATDPEDERQPLRGVRKRIFEGMSRSKHTAAHFTFVEECDVTALIGLRERLRPEAQRAGVKLTFLPFICKAVVAALKKHPALNAVFDDATSEIVVRRRYHLGIAAATDAGLMVPVVRDADRRSLLDTAREITRLGEAAKAGQLRPEDFGGSTFTITSLGQQGGLFATPILNAPEVGILGVHQMKQKPVVRDGAIVVGDVMLLSLSFDHRIIDGHVGAAFAYEIIGYLEQPDRLFLEMG